MEVDKIGCEEEPIHLLGLIQAIGYLIVLDEHANILSLSENCKTAENLLKKGDVLGKPILDVLHTTQGQLADVFHHLSPDFWNASSARKELSISISHQPCIARIYPYEGKVYLEIEHVDAEQSDYVHRLGTEFFKLQHPNVDIWETLSQTVQEILGFDRVMIYQFLEDGSGVVIGERLSSPLLDSYMGMNYPEFDIPKQARELYTKHLCRFIADTASTPAALVSLTNLPIDLSATEIRSLSPVHIQYLKNADVSSSISFSIMVDNRLWGLVCCQHHSAKHADPHKRNFCTTLTNYAALLFKQRLDKKRFVFIEECRELELKLKEKILLNNNLFDELQHAAPLLCDFMETDGFAVVEGKSIFLYGATPAKEDVKKIEVAILAASEENIFKTNSFPGELKEAGWEPEATFPGIALIHIEWDKGLSLIWFRRELVQLKRWAGKPEKHYVLDHNANKLFPSPRTSFNQWAEEVKGTSRQWGERDIHFLTRLKTLLLSSVVQKSAEIVQLNHQLVELNNALDTYSYTVSHDLQNPLAAIKLSAQMLLQKEDLPQDLTKRFAGNILNGLDTIQNMLVKIHEFSKASSFEFEREVVLMEEMIPEISINCKERFQCPATEIRLGDLFPVFGEKTLLYQLLINLIGNAVKYSSQASTPVVHIESFEEAKGIRYFIRDNGIGMDDAEIDSIFEIFKRMSNSTGFDGSGVGMAIVKRITDRLGITIQISSTLHEGTTIELFFPIPAIKEKYVK